MEVSFGIVLSILSATATAIWTVWTWNEQHKEEKIYKRDQISALYLNPFLFAAQELQGRLYDLLNQQELEFFKKEYPETYEVGSLEALELLYVLVKYFGWYWYLYRYSPYTKDPEAIRLVVNVIATFANRQEFKDDAFYFPLSEQRSLGQTFVRMIGQAQSVYPEFEAISFYQFAEEITQKIKKDRPLYQNIIKTIEMIDSTNIAEKLQGRDRLIVAHNHLVDLLHYLEDKEGFCVASRKRKKIVAMGSIPDGTEIIHAITGRVRLRIPDLRNDTSYAERLRHCLQSLADIQEISLNLEAASVVIRYNPTIPITIFQQRLFEAIAQCSSVNFSI